MTHTDLIKKALSIAAVATGSWYLYKILVRPFLSPLRKVPGRPYKPIVGNMLEALKEEAMENTINWMKHYKSLIIRFYFLYGEERILVADPKIVKYIMVTNSKNYIRQSTQNLDEAVPGFLLLLNGDEHHALRKLLNPVFNSHSVNEYISVFEDVAKKVVTVWRRELELNGSPDVTVAAQDTMCRLTLDALGICAFDYEMGSVEKPDSSGVQSFKNILLTFQIRLSQMLPLQWLPTRRNKQAWKDFRFFKTTINKVVAEKRKKLSEGDMSKDVLSLLLRARDENGNPLSDKSLSSQVGGFLFAGFETTSTNLTWTLLMLAEHPEIQDKVRQEIMSLLPDINQPITSETLESLEYLTCVIKESLRLYPPVSVLFKIALHDDYLGGYFIPAGTAVGISVGAVHRLPQNWEDPLSFKPERFLEKYDRYKFIPFGGGPYMCIGHIFSLTESKVVLATLLRNFRIALPANYTYRRVRHLTVKPSPPLKLLVSSV